jgi:hypothetical protein
MLLPYRGCTPAPAESIERWRIYSRRFLVFLDVAQRLHRGEVITDTEVWDQIGRPHGFASRSLSKLEGQRERLMRAVNLQLASVGIQPILLGGTARNRLWSSACLARCGRRCSPPFQCSLPSQSVTVSSPFVRPATKRIVRPAGLMSISPTIALPAATLEFQAVSECNGCAIAGVV